jgi:hypothetical protein
MLEIKNLYVAVTGSVILERLALSGAVEAQKLISISLEGSVG